MPHLAEGFLLEHWFDMLVRTALFEAFSAGGLVVAKGPFALGTAADATARGLGYGITLLIAACAGGHAVVVRWLLASGALGACR